MQLKQLLTEEDGVSPVIGVILMVAITVILAAVIASFVLGLGDTAQQTTPQASFSFDYDATDGLTITHDGGDSIQANEVYVRGDNLGSTGVWHDFSGATPSSGTSDIVAGNSVTLSSASDDYEVRVVYQSQEGDSSATLAQDSGPGA